MNKTAYLKIINAHLKKHYLLNDDKTKKMLPVFFTTLMEHMASLEMVQESGDLEQLGKTGHMIKGALLNLGLSELSQKAYAIEKNAKEGNTSTDYKSLIKDLQEEIMVFTS